MTRVGNGSSAAVVPSQLMQNAKISQSSKLRGATTFSPMKSVGPHNMASQQLMNPNSNSKLDVNIFGSSQYIDGMQMQLMAQSHRGLLTNRPEMNPINQQSPHQHQPHQHLSQIVSSVEGGSSQPASVQNTSSIHNYSVLEPVAGLAQDVHPRTRQPTISQAQKKQKKHKTTNQLLLQASMGTQRGTSEQNQMLVSIPVTAQFQDAISNAIQMGAAAMQIGKLVQLKQKRALQAKFERWKFQYLAKREGIQVITQTKYMEVQASESMLSRRLHDGSSSKSFYMDISNASQTRLDHSQHAGGLSVDQIVLTKGLAAMFRYKSRRVANFFWKWKFAQPTFIYRSTIQPQTHVTQDSEVDELMKKYKLFDQVSDNGDNSDGNVEDLADEVTISNQKKGEEFDQPVQHAGPAEKKLFEQDQEQQVDAKTRKPDDGQPKPQIYYQILNSKNKDFGKILRTSES